MSGKLKYIIYVDSSLREYSIDNILEALKLIEKEYDNAIKLEPINRKEIDKSKNKIDKSYVFITSNEESLRKWQIEGGKALYLNNKKEYCQAEPDKISITNNPKICKNNCEVQAIYDFLLRCIHLH